MTPAYFADMKIIDERLTSAETKLAKLEIVLKKILSILEEIWQPLQSHSE